MRKKILFIAHRIPYPPNKGDKIRSYHILRYLSRTCDVWLACLVDDPGDILHLKKLYPFAKQVFHSSIDPRMKRVVSLSGIPKGEPISVPYFYSRSLQRKIDGLLDREKIDAVLCFSSPTAEYIFRSRHEDRLKKDTVRIMDLIDMDSEKWRQYGRRAKAPFSWIYRREAKYLLEYEKRIVGYFDRVLLVSEAERKIFRRRIPCQNVQSMSNGVDLEFFHADFESPLEKKGVSLVFTGAMDYFPNIEGALWFVDHVLPRIRKERPDIRFYIVGNRPAKELEALRKMEGIHVTGFVEDIRDYIAMADVCVVPLRIARGIQNKVLEAMAMGKAVVTTPEGFEGIDVRPGSALAVAGDPDAFAQAILDLVRNPEYNREMGLNARRYAEIHFSWEGNLSIFNELLR